MSLPFLRTALSLSLALGLGAAASAAPAAPAAAAASAVLVPTVKVSTRAVSEAWSLDAVVEAVRQSTVGAQASGSIVALRVKAGDRVKAGQELARIDARETQAGLNQSQAAVEQAEANLRNARLNYERTKDLRTQGYVSSSALDSAKAQYDAALAARSQASAGQSQAALARNFTSVTAPYDGVIASTQVQAGDLAVPGRAIVTMYAPQPLRATVQLPMSLRPATEPARVAIELPHGGTVRPTGLNLLPSADPVAQTREWRLALPEGTQAVPGQSVRVRVDPPVAEGAAAAEGARGLTVPPAAVVVRGELTGVYLVRDGRFVLRAVRLGGMAGDHRVVVAGLKDGDQVATDGVRAGLAGAAPRAEATP